MRIKWNRHLDGSATRQPEEDSEPQESDKKKNGASSSSSGIFRIFRRKKGRKRGDDDDGKTGTTDNGNSVQKQEIDDECASISSTATCTSQPVSEGFTRDRASSLFSSFRLSLPGSKRKKRRIAPAPSDTLLNEEQQQQSESQVERYSTPDLRKPSVVPDIPQVSHSTSSPSVRNLKATSTSVHFWDVPNCESVDNVKLNGTKRANSTSSSSSKLYKSVSFSNCGRLFDTSHSTRDKVPTRAANSTVMVEEDSSVPVSESPVCMSDNLFESKLKSFGDSSSTEANAPNPHRQLSDEQVDSGKMTKTGIGDGVPSKDTNVSKIDEILTDIVSEIRGYRKGDEGIRNGNISVQGSGLPSSANCDSKSLTRSDGIVNTSQPYYDGNVSARSERCCDGITVKGGVQSETNNGRYDMRVNIESSPGVQHVGTEYVLSPVPEWNSSCEAQPDSDSYIVFGNENTIHERDSNLQTTEVLFNKNLYSPSLTKHAAVSPSKAISKIEPGVSTLNSKVDIDTTVHDTCENSLKIAETSQKDMVTYPITDSRHLISHLRSLTPENPSEIKLCKTSNSPSFLQNDTSVHLYSENKLTGLGNNTQTFPVSTMQSIISENSNSKLKDHSPDDFNITIPSMYDCDQQVPNRFSFYEYPSSTSEQEVPEFEQSLLEFEKTCDNYTSSNNVQFSDCVPTIPQVGDSRRMKSVLITDCSFQKSHAPENTKSKLFLDDVKDGENSLPTNHSTKGIDANIKAETLLRNDTNQNSKLCSSFNNFVPSNSTSQSSKLKNSFGASLSKDLTERINAVSPDQNSSLPTDLVVAQRNSTKNAVPDDCATKSLCAPSDIDPCQSSAVKSSLPVPPKQWINNVKPIEDKFDREVCTDRVQCTAVHGKNLCHEPCLAAFPTTVMHGESDLGFIDTPQLSSTLETLDNQSGRECNLIDPSQSQKILFDEQTPRGDMVSNLSSTLSSLHEVLDCSLESVTTISENPVVYLEPEISESYRHQHRICDPLIYSPEGTKATEHLVSESYLGHNFSDIINDISRDYVQSGQGLIEISNPYEGDSFIVPEEISIRNFMNGLNVSISNGDIIDTMTHDLECSPDVDGSVRNHTARNVPEEIEILNECDNKVFNNEVTLKKVVQKTSKKPNIEHNGDSKKISSSTEKNNMINKSKSSMIPCRKKGPDDGESKRIETKIKPKRANSIPKLRKNDSIHAKNSLRMLSKLSKDSDVGYISEQNKSSARINGNYSDISVVSLNSETGSKSNDLNSEATVGEDSGYYASEDNTISNTCTNKELKQLECSYDVSNLDDKSESSSVVAIDLNSCVSENNECDGSESVQSYTFVPETLVTPNYDTVNIVSLSTSAKVSEFHNSLFTNGENDSKFIDELDSECANSLLNDDEHIYTPSECSESTNYQTDIKSLDIINLSRKSSLPVELIKRSFSSSKESLTSQVTNSSSKGISRIPRKQAGTRGAQPSGGKGGPVRPPMWLSKAELTQEIQRLGTLCEARTKELNRLKMETKHVSVGFDAFASLFKYMVEDLNGLSVPNLTEDLQKTLKQLELTKQDLAYYEKEVEEIKSHHCQELNDLSNKLFEVYQSEVAELNAKHQEEINHLKSDHQKRIDLLTATYDTSSAEAKAHTEKMVASMEQEIANQREELQLFQEREIKDLEEKHAEGTKMLQEHVEQLKKKCAELKQHAMSMEDAMRKDTDSKLQWVSTAKSDLEKEVESLKAVLEMKNKELHTLRVQNLEMEKQLEELPIAREKIKMLLARAEDLEALMIEKTNIERRLSTENQQMRDTYEKESKVNRRLSMENEELQWRLRQAENSIISGSFAEVPELQEVEENCTATSPTKSPGPHVLSRSVFFTYVDKDDSTPHSPRSAYKKITPGFSAGYKTSPAKSSKSPPAPSPRRAKSHSEPPQPAMFTSTPRKIAKLPFSKSKGSQKRQRSESTQQNGENAEGGFSSVMDSMTSSISSESSVFEHRERLLDEHKEHIINSLEILREQRSAEYTTGESTVIEKRWCSDDIQVTGELSNLVTEDMSRSAEFSDPKAYYQMTFAVLKETGDVENSSTGNSPVKEVMSIKHSKSEDNINSCIDSEDAHTVQVMSMSVQEVNDTTTVININEKKCCTVLPVSTENVQTDTTGNAIDNSWRTI